MKFWRPGITGKLFLAIFATCIVLLISMHWAVRISFERGFIDYIKRGNEQRLTMLSDALSEQYAQHGSWAFLRNNDRFIFQLLRTFERDNDDRSPPGHAMKPDAAPDGPPPDGPPDGPRPRPEMPPHGWRTMFWVVDQSGRVLVGPRERVPEDGTQRSIVVNGAEVGKVIASPVERLTRNTDINFDRQQKRTSWLIVALATLLAALATFPLARGLLAPVKRLVEGTHKLAAGDFSTRVTVTGGDELGRLAQDFNQLASTLERNQQMRRDLMADISHELRTPLAVSLPEQAMIFGDRDRLMQLFNNLLENSLRYTDSGGSLHITARRSGRMLVIDFADSAPGVSDEQLARLCERFYRAEGSRNRASGGSGLGLAICLNIVAAHGGTLRADHSPFGGVSIKVELPLEHDLPRDV
ncbi:ATP-binding protein [Klebsiella pneumoniae]|uniref:ATP-binding protein n=1 Tax=Klebsiella pneumoniae TaxID=573 RepID=UPI0028E01E89|nr:ATP-binding protein [Klebsiella pneumoniae]MDT8743124.1 ATP-binding protein [Klebsiella pneumoniae]